MTDNKNKYSIITYFTGFSLSLDNVFLSMYIYRESGDFMKYKIVSDSSSNLTQLKDIDFSIVPLHVTINNQTYAIDQNTNMGILYDYINNERFNFNTTTNDWLNAFGDADIIFGVTFTSHLSNSFECARAAKQIYEKQHPNKKVFIIDSLSTGPQVQLLISKLNTLIKLGKSYQEIRNTIMDYKEKTRLLFFSNNLDHLGNNGRINLAIAKKATSLGYKILGKANFEGSLVSTHMCLGHKNTFKKLIKEIQATGYKGGNLIISHTHNESTVNKLCAFLKETFGNIQIEVVNNTALCSCYIKNGGIFIGYEI